MSDHSIEPQLLKVRLGTNFGKCNYKCEYCVTDQPCAGDAQESAQPLLSRIARNLLTPGQAVSRIMKRFGPVVPKSVDWDVDKYLRVIDQLAGLPYALDVRIGVGGETFISKPLVEGARQLSNHKNVWAVNLISNLSFGCSQYRAILDGFDTSKLAMVCSYHPTQIEDHGQWIETARQLSSLVDLTVVLVAWPPVIADLHANHRRMKEAGLSVFVQAFNGWYEDRKYPESYTDEERAQLRSVFHSRHDYEHMVNLKQPGECYAGMRYVYVDLNGDVWRCGTYQSLMGNIFTTFELNSEPKPCPGKECWCDTENLNTVQFNENYKQSGRNQHKYEYRRSESPGQDEWSIDY